MTTNKDKSIKEIYQLFEDTSNLVLAQLDRILKAIKDDEYKGITATKMSKLVKNENRIDENEIKLDTLIIQTIVLYKPVASDIRKLFAIYRMINDLERIGDLSMKVANLLNRILETEFKEQITPLLGNMMKGAIKMVQDALLSFINKDSDLALATIKRDDKIDRLNEKLLKRAIKEVDVSSETSQLLIITDIRSILSSIERIGDHATNIGEASIYALSGSNIKHQDLNS